MAGGVCMNHAEHGMYRSTSLLDLHAPFGLTGPLV